MITKLWIMKKILLLTLVFASGYIITNAQVIFTDINPDVTLNQVTQGETSLYLSMTNGTDTDFQIINSYTTVGDSTYSETIVIPDSGNAVATDALKNPLALTA